VVAALSASSCAGVAAQALFNDHERDIHLDRDQEMHGTRHSPARAVSTAEHRVGKAVEAREVDLVDLR